METLRTYIRKENWKKVQQIILKDLTFDPDSHWLWATLSLSYYEQYKYDKALKSAQKALSLAPHCPYVLWHYAGALYMHGLAKEALTVWKKILRRGLESIAHGECGEGMSSSRSLLNDCNYRIGRCYEWIGQKTLAIRYFRKYIQNRKKGIKAVTVC